MSLLGKVSDFQAVRPDWFIFLIPQRQLISTDKTGFSSAISGGMWTGPRPIVVNELMSRHFRALSPI
jgi:hypothetical protein